MRASVLMNIGLLLLLGGCASEAENDAITRDKLPLDVPQGVVEFVGYDGFFEIFSRMSKDWVFVGKSERLFWDGAALRLVRRPGKYTFQVRVKRERKTFAVEVKQGMITPVQVYIETKEISRRYGMIRYVIYLRKMVMEPVPYREYKRKNVKFKFK